MITPYLIKSLKEYLTLCFANKLVNIIPARAPIGVKKAPIFEYADFGIIANAEEIF